MQFRNIVFVILLVTSHLAFGLYIEIKEGEKYIFKKGYHTEEEHIQCIKKEASCILIRKNCDVKRNLCASYDIYNSEMSKIKTFQNEDEAISFLIEIRNTKEC